MRAAIVGRCRLEYPRGDAVFDRGGPAQVLIVVAPHIRRAVRSQSVRAAGGC